MTPNAMKFSDVRSLSVENAQGEKLGKIDDIVYDNQSGEFRYAALSLGGFLGTGNKLYAVPVQALKVANDSRGKAHHLQFDADKKSLENAPGFDKDRWPDVADKHWSVEVDRYYSGPIFNLVFDLTRPRGEAVRMSQLIGRSIKNNQNDDVGKVDEAVVDLAHARIRYLAVSFGGWLGIGDKLFAVPFSQFRSARDANEKYDHLVLNVSKESMKQAPGFDKNHWPDFAQANWSTDIDAYYRDTTARNDLDKNQSAGPRHHAKLSQLNGLSVQNNQGEKLGSIHSLVIDLNDGTIHYAAVSVGGFLGVGDKLLAMPWQALSLERDTAGKPTRAVLSVDKARLEQAPGFDKDHWPDFADAQWAANVHNFYGARPQDAGDQHALLRSDKIVDLKIKNSRGESLGSFNDLVIDGQRGSVCYAAMSFGGVLGIGDKLFAVPWKEIHFGNEPQSASLVATLDVDKQSLERAPSFDKDHWPDMADPNWAQKVDEHYQQTRRPSSIK